MSGSAAPKPPALPAFTTVGGDLEGALSVIANLPKTVVIAMLQAPPSMTNSAPWIAAHAGSRWNEYADSLATAYLREELSPSAHARAAGLYIGGTAIGGMTGRLVAGPVAEASAIRRAAAGPVNAAVIAPTATPASEPASSAQNGPKTP